PGHPATLLIHPDTAYNILTDPVTTSSKATDINVERSSEGGHEVLTVTGKISSDLPEKHIYKNVTEPALYAGYNLKSFLRQRGIEFTGKVIKGKTPSDAKLLSEVVSWRLYDIITDMNKFSNNFVAEMLAKDMAAELTGKQGTMDLAVDKIREFLHNEVGLEKNQFQLNNVSGFTRKNEFTARQFVEVLTWAHDQFTLAPEFIQSLPVAGVDGTLEKRFKGMSGERKIRAKTGLLNGVVALSGFAGRRRGEEIVFSFIFNGGENEARVRDIFDGLASQLTK
ncbi:MAG: D-alanyl-D-alanine carboxypeptidase/D-alanyl-D-alanine-endopeptidase, partial [Candidatus Paceibacterales bacterium]